MKYFIFLFVLLILLNITTAYKAETTNLDIYFTFDNVAVNNEKTLNFSITAAVGEDIAGEAQSDRYYHFLGLPYNFTKTIQPDTSPPVVRLEIENNTNFTTISAVLNYNVSDSSSIANCSLYINNSINITNSSISKGTTQTFSLSAKNGDYTWKITCYDIFSQLGNSTTQFFNLNYQPAAGAGVSYGGTVSEKADPCQFHYAPKNITFHYLHLNETLTFINANPFTAFLTMSIPEVPTIFGMRGLLYSEEKKFNITGGNEKEILLWMSSNEKIRHDTTVSLLINSSDNCSIRIPITIKSVPPVFYDIRVVIDNIYYTEETFVNFSIIIENKGDLPDKDTVLSVYAIDEQGNKTYIHNEMLYEVPVGTTEKRLSYYLPANISMGKHRIGIEYETEEQGLLTAYDTFFVISKNEIYTEALTKLTKTSGVNIIMFFLFIALTLIALSVKKLGMQKSTIIFILAFIFFLYITVETQGVFLDSILYAIPINPFISFILLIAFMGAAISYIGENEGWWKVGWK